MLDWHLMFLALDLVPLSMLGLGPSTKKLSLKITENYNKHPSNLAAIYNRLPFNMTKRCSKHKLRPPKGYNRK